MCLLTIPNWVFGAQLELFSYANNPLASKVSGSEVAGSKIKLNQRLNTLKSGDELVIHLPDGGSSKVTVSTVSELPNGDKTILGSNSGQRIVATIGKDSAYANIRVGEQQLNIGHSKERGTFVYDQSLIDAKHLNLQGDAVYPKGWKEQQRRGYALADELKLMKKNLAAMEETSVIRVLFLYSNEYGNKVSNPTTRFNQLIAFSNQTYLDAGINIRLELADTRQVNFNNATSNLGLLNALTESRDGFENVGTWRSQAYADLVTAIAFNTNSFSTSGIAWVNGDQKRYGFSVNRYQKNGSDGVFTHEIGHNLGSGHEYRSSNPNQSDPCKGGYTGYSCGHGKAGDWGTIMSYLPTGGLGNIYSDPNKQCKGAPCGVPKGQTNAADNVRSFNISRRLVANFEPDPPVIIPPVTNSDTMCIPVRSKNSSTMVICL